MAFRHRDLGFARQAFDFGQIQPVGLAAALQNAKALLADARQAQKAVRQLMEVDDLRQGPDIEGLRGADLAAFADQRHAEALLPAHAASHHVHVARFKNAQRQRTLRETARC